MKESFREIGELNVKEDSVAILWFNKYSGTVIKSPSTTIVVDPVEVPSRELEKAKPNVILVSHEHYDHLEEDTVENLAKATNAEVIANSIAGKQLQTRIEKLRVLRPGGEEKIGNVVIRGFTSSHPGEEPLTLLITTEDNISIYHAIDSKEFAELRDIGKYEPDIAIVPIGIAPGVSYKTGVEITKLVKPRVVIPHHTMQGFKEFERSVKEELPDVEVEMLKKGEIYTYAP